MRAYSLAPIAFVAVAVTAAIIGASAAIILLAKPARSEPIHLRGYGIAAPIVFVPRDDPKPEPQPLANPGLIPRPANWLHSDQGKRGAIVGLICIFAALILGTLVPLQKPKPPTFGGKR